MHTSPEVIAVMALGDEATADQDRTHVDGCAGCQAELDAYSHTLRLARELVTEVLERPADHVWERISREIGASRDAVGATYGRDDEAWRRVSVPDGFGSAAELARASLAARPDWPGAHGTAVVEAAPADRRVVHIRMQLGSGSPARDASVGAQLAAWLIAPDLSSMVRLGDLPQVADADVSFDLPSDLDLLRYPVVDLSRQPADDDGSAVHSGDSIVRGVLA